jgi:peptidoglycan/LPS O-acetylase OafA/YrhL
MSLLTILFSLAAAIFTFFVFSKHWRLPILFELGLGLTAMGALVFAFSTHDGWLNPKAFILIALGLAVMLLSTLRQEKKRARLHRSGDPQEIDVQSLRHPSGGKQ